METRRFRFTVRRGTAVVALVAFLSAGIGMGRKVVDYKRRAESHQTLESICCADYARFHMEDFQRRKAIEEDDRPSWKVSIEYRKKVQPNFKDEMTRAWAWASWHARMKERYQRAMWRPWLPLEAAPPPPSPLPADYDPH
jgi:hypothetical protein